MCNYADYPVIPRGCVAKPKHVITVRDYALCAAPAPGPDSGDLHCADAEDSGATFGSSRCHGPCPACQGLDSFQKVLFYQASHPDLG